MNDHTVTRQLQQNLRARRRLVIPSPTRNAGQRYSALIALTLLYAAALARHEQIVNARQWLAAVSQPAPQ